MKYKMIRNAFIFLTAGIAASHFYINNTDRIISKFYKDLSYFQNVENK